MKPWWAWRGVKAGVCAANVQRRNKDQVNGFKWLNKANNKNYRNGYGWNYNRAGLMVGLFVFMLLMCFVCLRRSWGMVVMNG